MAAFVPAVGSFSSAKLSSACSIRRDGVHGFFQRSELATSVPKAQRATTITMKKPDVPLNVFKPAKPYVAKCVHNKRIVDTDAGGETMHMVFDTKGEVPYVEGQSIGVIAPGEDKKGKPHKMRLYSIASTAHGDYGDDKSVSLCVKRLVYTDPDGNEQRGVCSNFLCDLKEGDEVKISGPVGTTMLMPADPNATIIMLATGTGIAPFRAFIRRAFAEDNPDYKFTGLMWLFLGVPTSSTLLYRQEFEDIIEEHPDNLRLDWAISREQTNKEGQKMYLQHRMADYAEELKELFKKDNTYVYMCGLKGMEPGIDDLMAGLFEEDGINWTDYRKGMKKAGRWEVETY